MTHWTEKLKIENDELKQRIAELEKQNVSPSPAREEPPRQIDNSDFSSTEATRATTTSTTTVPVPLDYRMLVDEILNKTFEIEIRPRPDLPVFEFVIKVPQKYSNAMPKHWETYKCDERIKVIDYATGAAGVRDYCEKVFNNFNTTTQTLIVSDRVRGE